MGFKEIEEKIKMRKRAREFMERLEGEVSGGTEIDVEGVRSIIVDEFNRYVMGGMREVLKLGGGIAGGYLLALLVNHIARRKDGKQPEGSEGSKEPVIPKEVEEFILRELRGRRR